MSKQDKVAGEIVSGLRAHGVFVRYIEFAHGIAGCPDILWAFNGSDGMMELKSKGGRLSNAQKLFQANWPGRPVPVVKTLEQALLIVGIGPPF